MEGLHQEELDLQLRTVSEFRRSPNKSSYDKQGGVGDKCGLRQCRAPEMAPEVVN